MLLVKTVYRLVVILVYDKIRRDQSAGGTQTHLQSQMQMYASIIGLTSFMLKMLISLQEANMYIIAVKVRPERVSLLRLRKRAVPFPRWKTSSDMAVTH